MASDVTSIQPGQQGGWIHGRATDLLIGCGLAYILALPLLLAAAQTWSGRWPRLLMVAFPIVFAMPHYGATVLRVYEERSERRKYAFFSVHLTLGLLALLLFAVHDPWLASLCVTIYFTWSPWHFAGQNYGLAMMFLRRRELVVPPLAKRSIHASFVLSALLAIVALHATGSATIYSVSPEVDASMQGVRGLRLGIPAPVASTLAITAGLSCLGTLLLGMGLLRRAGASLSDLAPTLLLALTQSLWFVVPGLADAVFGMPLEVLVFAPVWISVAHSCQYLWITSYYAERGGSVPSRLPYLVRCLLAGSLLFTAPILVLAPQRLGTIPYEAGLALLYYSVLNIHHFMLDGAIWKLRDGRIGRALLQGRTRSGSEDCARPRRPWLRTLVWSLGAACLGLLVLGEYEALYGVRGDLEQLPRTRLAASHLDLVGRGSPKLHALIAHGLALQGDHQGAEEEYLKSLAMTPDGPGWSRLSGATWYGLGRSHEAQRDWSAALAAYETSLAHRPEDIGARTRRADIYFRLEHSETSHTRAAEHRGRGIRELTRALELAPANALIGRELERARQRNGVDGSQAPDMASRR